MLTVALWVALSCTEPLAAGPANANASPAARRVLAYFHELAARDRGAPILSGQFAGFGGGANPSIMQRVHAQTGHWPALVGVDYADFSGGYERSGLSTRVPNRVAIDYWRQGGLVAVTAHMYNPSSPNGGGLRDRDRDAKLSELLEEGTEVSHRWRRQLDEIATGLLELKHAGVVVLWRPFHEMNSRAFWWGKKDAVDFVRVWRHMFDDFTKTRGLDNLLWVYSPIQGAEVDAYYPGDDHVDIVGLDAYTDFVDPQHIKGYESIVARPKPFGFTEYGPGGPRKPPGDYDYRRFLAGIEEHFPKTRFFMTWDANWSLASNRFTKELLSHPSVINRQGLPPTLFEAR